MTSVSNHNFPNNHLSDATPDLLKKERAPADIVPLVITLLDENNIARDPLPLRTRRKIEVLSPISNPSLLHPYWKPKAKLDVVQKSPPIHSHVAQFAIPRSRMHTLRQISVDDAAWGEEDEKPTYRDQLLSEAERLQKFIDSAYKKMEKPTTMGESYSALVKSSNPLLDFDF